MANWTKAGEVPELSGLFGPLHSPALEALLLAFQNRHRWFRFTCKSPSIVMEKTSAYSLDEVRDLLANGTLKEADLAHTGAAKTGLSPRCPDCKTLERPKPKAPRAKRAALPRFPAPAAGDPFTAGASKMECPYCGAVVDAPRPRARCWNTISKTNWLHWNPALPPLQYHKSPAVLAVQRTT